ncbi:MAG: N-6 DNA methylase [Anaerolineales bacterium]|nr:MAG: N-6 DNA methylase [Anaerolineales bacterium]
MLDSETKRRIDSARDILVGKVPDPKSQVEQITIALVYKFMDDMDRQSVELGGKASFFKGEFKKYGWGNIFDPRLGGVEMLNLYGEAITRMSQNANLPELFRNIFKNAYLPYRDPETLKLFLKTINDFTYDHSEKLGDAFEYLLSVLGSQGDAGQFRTPRHIIDFMVQVVDPKKNETVLDPACGTAGFLISAYKHIVNQALTPTPLPQGEGLGVREGRGGLSAQDKQRLYENFTGYDISPDMVRLSLVNMYLHGFVKPQIHEYDTLASEERWNDTADVILANPPFMSPKGGIMPHKKFSVQSNRSEVLFVDYMAEHLTPNGRAAIIVPEGIIFQSAGAYKQLRKYLIEHNFLWAVVSLPAGAFNPYSGVKTSILLLDKSLAKKTDRVLFVKVENDGFSLGAQRNPIEKNDLPQTLKVLKSFRASILDGKLASFAPETGSALLVSISKLEENDYNLSADRYREVIRVGKQTHPMVAIGDICTFEYGKPLKAENRIEGEYPVFGSNGIVGYHNEYLIEAPFLVVGRKGSAGEVHYSNKNGFPIDTTFYVKLENEDKVILDYLFHVLKSLDLQSVNTQAGVPGLNRNDAYKIQIPLPPLEVQRQLVDEIAAHHRIIGGARQVIENWKPDIELEFDENWEVAKLDNLCEIVRGSSPRPRSNPKFYGGGIPRLMVADVTRDGMYVTPSIDTLTEEGAKQSRPMKKGDLVMAVSGQPGVCAILAIDACIHDGFAGFRNMNQEKILTEYAYHYLMSQLDTNNSQSVGAVFKNLNLDQLRQFDIPLPPLEIQREIVARIESERAIVHGNRELIRLYVEKVKKVIERVWEG